MSQQPLPVQPLSYGGPSQERPGRLLRLAAWAACVYSVAKLTQALSTFLMMHFTGAAGSTTSVHFTGGYVGFSIAGAMIDIGMITGAVLSLRQASGGRATLMVACVADAAAIAAYTVVSLWQFSKSFSTTQYWWITNIITYAITGEILPILIFMLARRDRGSA
ncbi:MAG TPA: hypothetical protein VG269_18515 [Tepidisphaeraceae bacterium]|nr:hypothetical protein [Tepidisphaeraceae bacterium]